MPFNSNLKRNSSSTNPLNTGWLLFKDEVQEENIIKHLSLDEVQYVRFVEWPNERIEEAQKLLFFNTTPRKATTSIQTEGSVPSHKRMV